MGLMLLLARLRLDHFPNDLLLVYLERDLLFHLRKIVRHIIKLIFYRITNVVCLALSEHSQSTTEPLKNITNVFFRTS